MSSHRRVVRTNSTLPEVPVVPKKTHNSFLKIASISISIFWKTIKILWYWIERLFLVSALLTLTIGLAWWLSQKPSLLRDWAGSDAVLPQISWSGDIVTINSIRDHRWNSVNTFVSSYLNNSYSLDDIESLEYIITPFSDSDGPAHTMFSFGFSGGRHLVISPEIRKEKGEVFEALGGVLNQYEIVYLIATEEDIIQLRTNYRKNQVFMYPIRTEKSKIQSMFQSMLLRTNKLSREPEFYNTLWNNCATNMLSHVNSFRTDKIEGGRYTLLPSHSDELIYSAGLIDTQLSLIDARNYYRIDELAMKGTDDMNFSQLIRKPIK